MGQKEKLLQQVMSGKADQSISFDDLRKVVGYIGFTRKNTSGDHHIYSKPGIVEIINLQPKGGKAKPYQVKQVREIILKYKL